MKFIPIFALFLFISCKKTSVNTIIVCDGNSLTYGRNYGNPYPEQLEDLLPDARIYNFGVTGQQTSEMIKDAAVQVDAVFDRSKNCICVVWEITNDIYFNGNAQMAVDRFKDYCLSRKAKGWKVIALSVLPRNQQPEYSSDSKDYQNKIAEANQLLAAQWQGFADDFIDLRKDDRLTDADNKEYFTDGIHLTTDGMSIIAKDIAKEIIRMK